MPEQPNLTDPLELAGAGIYCCRHDNWTQGVKMLAQAVERTAGRVTPLPSRAYSYLGYGISRYKGQHSEGERLCRHALRLEFTEPENHLNLVRLYIHSGKRKEAVVSLKAGLTLTASHPELLQLSQELGVRRPPVLKMFSRRNWINRILGLIRHASKKP